MKGLFSFKFENCAFLAIVLLLNYILLANSQVNTGWEVRDLTRTDSCFSLDAAKWTASLLTGSNDYSVCQGVYLLAGYHILGSSGGGQGGQYMTRTYNNIQSHTMVYFTFMMYAIDTWNGAQSERGFDLTVGGKTYQGWTNYDYSNFPSYDCGGSWKVAIINIYMFGRVIHSGSSLTFTVTSRLDSATDNESWGFRDISILFATPPSTAPSESFCANGGLPIGNDPSGTAEQCQNTPGTYYISSTNTGTCHANCVTCFGPNDYECYSCKTGFGWDGVRCIQCDPMCTSCHGPTINECGSCVTGYLLYQNTTCVAAGDCPYPLAQTGCGYFCESPCSDPNAFVYWDQSCETYCNLPVQQVTILSSKTCYYQCATSDYLYWDGTCSSVCPHPPMTTGAIKSRNLCKYQCAAGLFRYWDGICLPTCNPPLVQKTIGGNQFCYYPCANSNDYLYWDGSCGSSCNSPLDPIIIELKKLCTYKCTSSQWLRFDGTCLSSCDSPYIQRIEYGSNFCDYPCTASQYLYWDGRCYSSCQSPPLLSSTLAGNKYCNYPCALNQYLNYDNTCKPSCNLPFTLQFIGNRNFCAYLCTAGQYLYENGSCIGNCLAPFKSHTQAGIAYCNDLCPNQVLFWNGTCIRNCDAPLKYFTNSSGTYCADPCYGTSGFYDEETQQCQTTCSTTLVLEKGLYIKCVAPDPVIQPVALVKLLHHLRYLDIKLPRKLERMSASQQMNFLSMAVISSQMDSARKWLLETVTFQTVGQYIVYSGFLANFLEELVLMAIMIAAGIVFKLLEYFARFVNSFYLQIFCERLCILTTWNLFLIIFTSSIGDIVFYTAIEFRTFNSTTIQENLSFLVCLTMFVAVIALFLFHIILLNRINIFKALALEKKVTESLPDYLLKWQSCQVLFRGFSNASIVTGAFYLIYQARIALPMMIATFLPKVPVVQTSFYMAINIIMISFIAIAKPINRKLDRINVILLEMIILITNLSAFVLVIFDHNEAWRFEIYNFFGDVIIAGNFCIHLLAGFFLPLKLFSVIQSARQARKERSSEELGVWMQLLFIPLQQGGLGFEQVQLVTAFTISRIKSASIKVVPFDLGGPVGPQININKIDESQMIQITEVQTPQVDESPVKADQIFTSLVTMPSPEKKTDLLAIPESTSYRSDVSQFKKRKSNNNSDLGSERNINTIEESAGEDEQPLTNRLKNVSNDDSVSQDVSNTSGPIKRRNLDLLPRHIEIIPITPKSQYLSPENSES